MSYKIWASGRQYDELLEGEFDNLEDALDEMRREWGGWPRRLEMPDGSNYKFSKTGEWRLPVIYKYFALRTDEENFTANQNYLINKIKKDKSLWMVIRLWARKPTNYYSLLGWEEDLPEIMKVFIEMLCCGLLEEALFADGSGFLEKKWKNS
jgi:hypothetical protein